MSISLHKISDKKDAALERLYAQYTTTFPPEETRSEEQFKTVLV